MGRTDTATLGAGPPVAKRQRRPKPKRTPDAIRTGVMNLVAMNESSNVADMLQPTPNGGVGKYQFDISTGDFGTYFATTPDGTAQLSPQRRNAIIGGKSPNALEMPAIQEFLRSDAGVASQDDFWTTNYYEPSQKELDNLGIPQDLDSLSYMSDLMTQRGAGNYAERVKPYFTGNTAADLMKAEMVGLSKTGTQMGGAGAMTILERRIRRVAELVNIGYDKEFARGLTNTYIKKNPNKRISQAANLIKFFNMSAEDLEQWRINQLDALSDLHHQ